MVLEIVHFPVYHLIRRILPKLIGLFHCLSHVFVSCSCVSCACLMCIIVLCALFSHQCALLWTMPAGIHVKWIMPIDWVN